MTDEITETQNNQPKKKKLRIQTQGQSQSFMSYHASRLNANCLTFSSRHINQIEWNAKHFKTIRKHISYQPCMQMKISLRIAIDKFHSIYADEESNRNNKKKKLKERNGRKHAHSANNRTQITITKIDRINCTIIIILQNYDWIEFIVNSRDDGNVYLVFENGRARRNKKKIYI